MAEVLARAKALQQEYDRFQLIREDVLLRFRRMDADYVRAQSSSGRLQPR
jgi:hypothetical protein